MTLYPDVVFVYDVVEITEISFKIRDFVYEISVNVITLFMYFPWTFKSFKVRDFSNDI